MKTPDENLDSLLRAAARDPRPADWISRAARGMEARVLQRLARPESWAEALFSLTSWRPLAAAVVLVLLIGAWTGSGIMDVFNDDWLTLQTEDVPDPGTDELDF